MPEPRQLLRLAVVGLAAYGVTLLGDYGPKRTVFREKPAECSRQRHQLASPRVTKPSFS